MKYAGSCLQLYKWSRLVLIFTLGLFTFSAIFSQSASITPSYPLNEVNLDAGYITVTLGSGETFKDYLNLKIDSFDLVDAPPGTSIESVTGISVTIAQIELSFNGTDFDVDYGSLRVNIEYSQLTLTTSGWLGSSNTIVVVAYDESLGIEPGPSTLDEQTLDASYLDITLTDEEFTIIGSIPNGNFSLNSEPTGLVIESVTSSDANHARMQLAYPPINDFDSPVTNFSINVSGAVLKYTALVDNLTSNNLTITAYNETPQARMSIDSTVLEERWLDVRTLTIDLVEERFKDYTLLLNTDFDLVDEPPGLEIGSITRTSAVSVDIHLQFNYTDFDADWPNFRVSIDQQVLVQSGSDLESDYERIVANIESATLTPDETLWEDNLDGRMLTIDLVNEVFQSPGSVDENDFILNNFPTGLEISSASAISTTRAQLTLQYTGLDFDTDITNFAVGIAPGVLRYTSAGNLNTGPITIRAVAENPVAFLTSDDVLTENNLDVRELTIGLVQEEFDPAVTINASHFRLRNEPPGLTIESAYRISTDSARILLQFVYNDFDDDITNFHVEIQASALIQTISGWLATNFLTINANTENPVARLSSDSSLTEERLDFRTLYIDLEEESFTNWVGLQTDNFALVNFPTGLSIQSVAGTTPTSVTIELNFNGTDFDNDIIDFHILIDSLILVQSDQDLASTFLTIQASLEPVVTNVSIPNDTMNIDDTVLVTITVQSDQGNTFSLNSGEIGGYPLATLSRENDTTYISRFIVTEFGDDYAAYENIPVTGVQLFNGLIPGKLHSQTIIQGNDLLDANRPVFIYIVDNTLTGEQDIGSVIKLSMRTDESGYMFDPTSFVNYVLFSSSTIQINPLSGGYYDLLYTVKEGDNDVSEGNLELEIIAVDIAGNLSLPFTEISPNDLSIDASRPLIDSAYISSPDSIIKIGMTLEITVEADQPGYRLYEDTRINYVPVGPSVTFNDLGNGNYQFQYTVQEDDTAVAAGNLKINIVLQDRAPYDNTSDAFTDLDPNNVAIYPNKPLANVSGSSEICFGDSAQVTITLGGGVPPWELNLSDGTDTITIYHIRGDTSFWTRPDTTTNYTVTRVVDSVGNYNDGSGNALITVHPLPNVEIKNLRNEYILTEAFVELDYTPADGKFTGPGISNNPWTFTPLLAGIENSPHTIIYEFTDENTCFNADTVIVEVVYGSAGIIFENGRRNACCNDSTFYINGYNDGNTIGTFSVEPEPPEGAFSNLDSNRAVLRPALYELSENKEVKIIYTYPDTVGLENNTLIRTMTIYKEYPTANFTWYSSCVTDDPILFEGKEIFHFPDTISSVMWKIYSGDTEILSTDTNMLSYKFPSDGTFRIVYSVTTVAGCIDSEEKPITLSPTHILSEDSYFEDFEDTLNGWASVAAIDSPNSWTYGVVDSGKFPENAASGTRSWYTDLPSPEKVENSWVQSPCFNFKEFYRPMVSLDIKRSFQRDRDGAVLQYRTDNSNKWINVGSWHDGALNWYNSEKISLPPGVGEQRTGWTADAEEELTIDDHWIKAAHGLDELIGQPIVQFRIAFGSTGDNVYANDGFAFDNFTIRQRNRFSVLEYFTNANTEDCKRTDTLVRNLIAKVPADVIDIQYHATGEEADRINLLNPLLPNNRMTVLGIPGCPMAVLNGGYEEKHGYPFIYDFSAKSESPNVEDIILRSYTEPDFKLTTDVYFTPERLEISTDIEALKKVSNGDIYLYTMVVQRSIEGSEYEGTNGTTRFWNVAREILPDVCGLQLKESWLRGDTENYPVYYDETDFPLIDDSSIMVVVFLQDDYTREILQAVTVPEYTYPVVIDTVTSTSDKLEPKTRVLLYPNPAGELVNVYFEEIPGEAMRFTLYDLSGKKVITDVIEPWQQRYARSLEDLEQGLYIVEIRTHNNRRVVHRGKLFHN
jgi:hypothetical protein